MNRRYPLFLLKLVVLVVLHSHSLFSQTSGKIVGEVRDAGTGAPLPGANVMVEGTSLGAATDTSGYYMILRVPPGEHTVRASFIGYRDMRVRNVEVLTDLTTTVNFELQQEAQVGEAVVVVAEKPLVRKDLTASEARVQSDQIDKMPVQEVSEILDLQAGVTRDNQGNLHIRGGRSSEIVYMVNGINVTDGYTREQALTVSNESVQELQVISGAFNAEYGNAMSGVVNIVTKTGGNNFNGSLEAWTGDYLSTRTDLFWNIGDIDPLAEYHLQARVSGPIIKDRITYFLTGRKTRNEGWLYGANAYDPQGRQQVVDGDTVQVRGDSSAVPMNPADRWNAQGALKWRLSDPLTLKLDVFGSGYQSGWYSHTYRLNPQGMRDSFGSGRTAIGKLIHALSDATLYETTVSYKINENKSWLYEDPYDPRYVHPDSLTSGAFKFYKAGTDLYRSSRSTESWIGKVDLTSQVNKTHQIKTGIEVQQDEIFFEDMTLAPARNENGQQIVPFEPEILPTYTPDHDKFTRHPERYAAYLQDKLEYEEVIINIGLRFDYFHSNGRIPADPQDPNIYNPQKLNHIYKDPNDDGTISLDEQTEENRYSLEEREEFWYNDASPKTQWSPRFGIGYPITDQGVIHFSYGIFQQIPDYSQLYAGDQLKLSEAQGIQGPFGNPNLDPEQTTMYELGLKQQLSRNIGIDITGYYRDIRDWISTSAGIPTYMTGVTYSKKINRDHANVKGVTVMVTRRLAGSFSFDIDYTYQIVKGMNSSPEDQYFALNEGAEPKKQLSPLNWDQRHALNLNVYVGQENWGCNLLASYNSGQPYTPEITSGTLTGQNVLSGLATNSRRRPSQFTVDVNAFRAVELGPVRFEFFTRIYNLFDNKNPDNVYADTGKPDYTLDQRQASEADPTWFVRPDFYSEPRKIHFGTRVFF